MNNNIFKNICLSKYKGILKSDLNYVLKTPTLFREQKTGLI